MTMLQMTARLAFAARACRSVLGPGFGAGGGGGAATEVTLSGLSTDPGQVLGTGLDGGVLLVGADIAGALDTTLGGIAWRQSAPEPALSYDAAARTLSITGGQPATLALATATLPGLMAAADKARLDAIEPGATADQTAQEIAAAIDADPAAETALRAALAVPATPAEIGAATAAQGALADTALQPGDAAARLAPDPVSSEAGDMTLAPGDARRFVKLTGAGAQTVTVDAGSLAPGEYVTLVKTGAGSLGIAAGTGAPTLINATGGTLTGIAQGGAVSIKATDVAGEYIVIGTGG